MAWYGWDRHGWFWWTPTLFLMAWLLYTVPFRLLFFVSMNEIKYHLDIRTGIRRKRRVGGDARLFLACLFYSSSPFHVNIVFISFVFDLFVRIPHFRFICFLAFFVFLLALFILLHCVFFCHEVLEVSAYFFRRKLHRIDSYTFLFIRISRLITSNFLCRREKETCIYLVLWLFV
jgi:hypothetical protein